MDGYNNDDEQMERDQEEQSSQPVSPPGELMSNTEDIVPHPLERELQFNKMIDVRDKSEHIEEGDTWFLMSTSWVKKWKSYADVRNTTATSPGKCMQYQRESSP